MSKVNSQSLALAGLSFGSNLTTESRRIASGNDIQFNASKLADFKGAIGSSR